MAEGAQIENMDTAAMEENSLDTDGEGVEEEKHSNEDSETETISNEDIKSSHKDDYIGVRGHSETTQKLDMTIEDEFVLVDFEYKDPLAEVTNDHLDDKRLSKISLLSYPSSTSSGSGISGLFHHLSVGEDKSGEIEKAGDGECDDIEDVTMSDVEILGAIEQDDECTPRTLSTETKEKLNFIVNNSVIGVVKGINEETIDKYCNFIERNFPVDARDWPNLKSEMKAASKQGPKIFVKCSRGKITGYKKMDNIKIVAFVKQQNGNKSLDKEIDGEVKDYNDDSDVDFNLDDHLMTPMFDDCVIRVEVRKLRKKDISSRVLVGYTEVPIKDIPSTAIESYYELQKEGAEGFRKISLPSSDSLGHLVLNLSRDEKEEDPNMSVPNILKQYLLKKLETIFSTSQTTLPTGNLIKYQLCINQNSNPNRQTNQVAYQKLLTEDGVYPKNETNQVSYNIDCVLTNRIELGVESRRRSISPGTNSFLTPGSQKRASSLSPSQSMISLMTSTRRESMGSNSSLISPENTPNKKKSSNMLSGILNKTIGSIGEDLNKTFGSIGEDITNLVSPSEKPTIRTIPINEIVQSLDQQKICNHTLPDKESISWDTKLEPISDVKFSSEELTIIYENAIIESIKSFENDCWDGSFPDTITTLLSMVKSIVAANRKEINLSKAEAYMKAHRISCFTDSILKKHIETILKSDASSENLKKYVEKSLKFIQSYRHESKKPKISAVLANLRQILNQDHEISFKIKLSVETSVTNLFKTWQKDIAGSIKEKSPSSTNTSAQICRDILNIHVFPETQVGYKKYQDMFSGILDYQQVIGARLIDLCKDIMKNNMPESEKRVLLKYDENSPRVKNLLLIYETFCAFKRIFDNLHQSYPDWLFDMYKQYPDMWVELALYKAETQVDNLLRHVRENEDKFNKIESESCQKTGRFSREDSVDDITNDTLVSFYGIAETSWKFREELNWPELDVSLSTGLKLIEGMAQLETRILNLFESIHLKDEEYDVIELSRTIKLLDGLLRRHHLTVNEIAALHSKIASDDEMNEIDQEYFKTKMTQCYEVIQKVKDKTKDEILKKIDLYCEGRRPKLKRYIQSKKLVNADEDDEDCLMFCMDKELGLMYKNIQEKYHSDVMIALWKVMEQELEMQFKDRKQRNLSKNKPARFAHFKCALPIIMDVKQGLYEKGIISDLSMDTLSTLNKDVAILTEDSKTLVNKVLRAKAQAQKIDVDENGNNVHAKLPSMSIKLAYVTKADKVMVEVVNIHNITPRENKTLSKIQLYLRFSPDRMGTGQIVEQSPVYEDIDRSIIFDLQGEPLKFEFSVDHVSAKKLYEDGFIIINLFHVNRAGLKLSIGECVAQVKMNGLLVTEMVQISSESEFSNKELVPSLCYQVQDFQEVYSTEMYKELHMRTEEEAKFVTARDDKVRKTSFFAKFS